MKKLNISKIELNDKTNKLNKKDYIIMGIMILIYSIISFYRLGNMSAPSTYYTFSDINDSVVVDFGHDVSVSKIRYEVGRRIRLRLTPELRFIPDDSIERGARVTELINKISRGEV